MGRGVGGWPRIRRTTRRDQYGGYSFAMRGQRTSALKIARRQVVTAGVVVTARAGGDRRDQIALNASTALVPPKAKPLLMAARTLRSRATLGVTSRSQSGSGSR